LRKEDGNTSPIKNFINKLSKNSHPKDEEKENLLECKISLETNGKNNEFTLNVENKVINTKTEINNVELVNKISQSDLASPESYCKRDSKIDNPNNASGIKNDIECEINTNLVPNFEFSNVDPNNLKDKVYINSPIHHEPATLPNFSLNDNEKSLVMISRS